jgi:hypothetical protein
MVMAMAGAGGKERSSYTTRFGALDDFEMGGVEIINDDPRHYAFSNVFDVASKCGRYEKIAVGKNMEYVIEAIRAEGVSSWRTAAHDEYVLVMDGEVAISFVSLDEQVLPASAQGSIEISGEPAGVPMGRIVARRGHMALLPAGSAYRFDALRTGVLLQQTLAGPDTQFRWAEICQSL